MKEKEKNYIIIASKPQPAEELQKHYSGPFFVEDIPVPTPQPIKAEVTIEDATIEDLFT